MRSVMVAALFVGLVAHGAGRAAQSPSATPGSRLDAMTWPAAEERLGPGTIVVLPLGSGATQHGQHLTLDTDQRLAEYLRRAPRPSREWRASHRPRRRSASTCPGRHPPG
jgi:hypothetical protein